LTYLGFITEGKLAAIFITPSLEVPNWPVIYIINTKPPHMKIYLEWLEIPCIGIYSGLFGSNFVFGSWMHEKYSLSV
jgi:hypothetical protein